jgi:hypothetical protein
MTLEFSDGERFDTSGEAYQIIKRHDGHYLIGNGLLIPVDSYADGLQLKGELEGKTKPSTTRRER